MYIRRVKESKKSDKVKKRGNPAIGCGLRRRGQKASKNTHNIGPVIRKYNAKWLTRTEGPKIYSGGDPKYFMKKTRKKEEMRQKGTKRKKEEKKGRSGPGPQSTRFRHFLTETYVQICKSWIKTLINRLHIT